MRGREKEEDENEPQISNKQGIPMKEIKKIKKDRDNNEVEVYEMVKVHTGTLCNDLLKQFMDQYEKGKIDSSFKIRNINCRGSCVYSFDNCHWYGVDTCTCRRAQVFKYLKSIGAVE